ncbi:MAG TPA: radical SAM family heme chaperone HemW [Bacteroidia bacterium]|nr:radical SAM family heme chaperone HemW [Bacteroidia bacterium]
MSHLYIHIPFCRQACHYCDFHFSTTLHSRGEMVKAIAKEISLRKDELDEKKLSTIYFGGGTPSLIGADELKRIFEAIAKHFSIDENAEITLEANPDDLSKEFLAGLRTTPVNRLSIGIQSFREEDLRMMNRAHNAAQAESSLRMARDAGFGNITADLIYGIPGMSDEEWRKNISHLLSFAVPHISAYCLTVEPKTALAHFVREGKAKPVDEEEAASHFQVLAEETAAAGFMQYEISNFARPGFIARHNSSYWFGEEYLGVGPSAHSFRGKVRRKNVSSNPLYLQSLAQNKTAFEEETLSSDARFNEFVMTRLRTMWGIPLEEVRTVFGETYYKNLISASRKWISEGKMTGENGTLVLTHGGKLLADSIASDFFMV